MSEKFGEVDEGNIAELKQGDILFSYSHDTWTNEDVDVTLSLSETVENKENYRLEYSKDNRTWTRYTDGSPITMTQNGKVYARVKDITGDIKTEGGYAEGEVTIIDKQAPTPGNITMKMASLGTPYLEGEEVYQNVEITVVNGEDEEGGSGHKTTTCTITGGRGEQDNQTGSIVLKASDNKYEVTVTTEDNVGNTSTSRAYIVNPTYSKETKPMEVEGGTYYLPEGFKLAEDTAWKINDGIVIEDKQENEWVWIPCHVEDGANQTDTVLYDRYAISGELYTETKLTSKAPDGSYYIESSSYVGKLIYEGLQTTSNDYKSIKEYGGYYIGRYESGKNNGNLVIQKDKETYTNVTINQCITLSSEMISDSNSKVYSKLSSSYAWDTAIMFIQKTHPQYGKNSKTKDGILAGQYNNNLYGTGKLYTGKTLPVCNIYDMGGNVYEITSEIRTDGSHILRSGGYQCNSSPMGENPGGRCGGGDQGNGTIGFRLTLYIKSTN